MSMTGNRSRVMLVLLAVLALLAAACGDDTEGTDAGDDDAAATTTTTEEAADDATDEPADEPTSTDPPDEPVELTATDEGVSESVIDLGVVFPDLSVIGRDPGDVEAKWKTIVDRINESGGINGRDITMHFRSPNPIADTASDQACTELTEDVGVFAAIGLFTRTTADCYAALYDTIVISAFAISAEQMADYTAPGITLVAHTERLVEARIGALVDGGVLTEGMNVALLGAAAAEPAQQQYLDALESAGIEVVADTILLADGTDLQELNTEMEVFAEVWRSRGAEAVVASSALLSQALLIGYNRTGLELPMILPEGTGVNPSLLRDNQGLDLAPFEFAISLGSPSEATQYEQGLNGVRECVDEFQEASGEEVALDESRNNLSPTIVACQTLDVFVAIATAAGPELTTESFAAAGEAFGPIEITAVAEASVGPEKFDLSDSVGVVSEFNPETAQFQPVG